MRRFLPPDFDEAVGEDGTGVVPGFGGGVVVCINEDCFDPCVVYDDLV